MGVNPFVLGLLRDLESRCERLMAMIVAHRPHSDVVAFHQRIAGNLSQLLTEVKMLRHSDQLQHEVLWPYVLADYQELWREISVIEELSLPVILRYDERDHSCAWWVKTLLHEIGHPPDLMPIVTATSDRYYWTYPDQRIIGVPAGDVAGMLGWPDLTHEAAHLILAERPELVAKFSTLVDQHFKRQREHLADIGASDRDSRWLSIAHIKWGEQQEGTWRIEFAADLIATFVMGPSYGWQHVRLAANRGSDPYDPYPGQFVADHPADQARLEAVLEMLKLLNLEAESAQIRQCWEGLLAIGRQEPLPPGYDLYYPQELIRQLAQTVFVGCQQLQLVPYTSHPADRSTTIVHLIDEAWRTFLSTPGEYSDWEQRAIAQLNKRRLAASTDQADRSEAAA